MALSPWSGSAACRFNCGANATARGAGPAPRTAARWADTCPLGADGCPAGELLSAWQTGTAADDELTSMAVDACGNVLVGGYARGALLPGQPNAGGEDMFLMKARL
jgi:hypothetical protein